MRWELHPLLPARIRPASPDEGHNERIRRNGLARLPGQAESGVSVLVNSRASMCVPTEPTTPYRLQLRSEMQFPSASYLPHEGLE